MARNTMDRLSKVFPNGKAVTSGGGQTSDYQKAMMQAVAKRQAQRTPPGQITRNMMPTTRKATSDYQKVLAQATGRHNMTAKKRVRRKTNFGGI